MGRKIPAKKHRGVKDPLVQQAKRLESLKGKINAPPKDPDEQPVPRSLTRLFAFQDQDRKKSINKKKALAKRLRYDTDASASDPAHNPISRLRKLPGESGRGFSLRINSAVKALHKTTAELESDILDLEAEDFKGQRMVEQRERRARKHRKALKARRGNDNEPETHLTRTQKLALKKKAKQMKASEASKDRQEVVYDQVSFGEVTHAPPILQFKSKGNTGAPRPGKRDLLLNSLLLGEGRRGEAVPGVRSRVRASLAPAERRRRERARDLAVAAYRALKAGNGKNK